MSNFRRFTRLSCRCFCCCSSVLNAESTLRAKEREILALKKKVEFLEATTADLVARMLTLKYARSSPEESSLKSSGAIQTSKTVPNLPAAAQIDDVSSDAKIGSLYIRKRHSVTDLGTV